MQGMMGKETRVEKGIKKDKPGLNSQREATLYSGLIAVSSPVLEAIVNSFFQSQL